MSSFESHPPHEIPNKKTSENEALLSDHETEAVKIKTSFTERDKSIPRQNEAMLEARNISSVRIISPRPFDKFKKSYHDNPILKESRRAHVETEIEHQAKKNLGLFKSGDSQKITQFLLDEKVHDLEFEKEISRTKEEYQDKLSDATFLSRMDWKILTGIKLFNKETFEHSVGTYLIAKEKIEERLKELGIEIQHEGVALEQFYRACLFHDVGKMLIPEFVLKNKTTDHEWAIGLAMLEDDEKDEIFMKIFDERGLTIPDEIRHDPEALANFFEENRIRAVEFVPIKSILNSEQLEQFEKLGLDPNQPLKKIMELHEKGSQDILNEFGLVVEAMLAGNHHNHGFKDKKLGEKPASLSALHISIEIASTILHLADIQHALNGDRSYHHKQPMLRILAFLVDDAEKGKILPGLTAAWIKDELKRMSPGYLNEVRTMSAPHQDAKYQKQRQKELELIEDFLEDNLNEFEDYLPTETSALKQAA